MSPDWVTRFAAEEKLRDQASARKSASASQEGERVQFQLRNVLDALHDRVAGDVKAFASEFPDRRIIFEDDATDDGFAVRRQHYPEVHLSVTPSVSGGSINAQYLFASGNGKLAPRLLELVPGGHSGFSLQIRDDAEQPFRSVEQLAEYLLVPVFSGRPR